VAKIGFNVENIHYAHRIGEEQHVRRLIPSQEQLPEAAVVGGDGAVQNGRFGELHHAGPRAARSALQLQHRHVVGGRRAEDAGGHKEGHLGPPDRPVAAQVEAVDPNLALKWPNAKTMTIDLKELSVCCAMCEYFFFFLMYFQFRS